ncbi:AI-2E family transporter [Siphonobacter aquaeclarae]|jgi:predicted PurR-regulated permease PerM|uniref:Predicted PurR-regulated permease PerM n=1 Tax=Siphonobacter aquaeclarae TaxID=563176 RepID=A0A1G9KJP1_9BACT|nr:AI-2E family transporter [Siphonobacter aquaeclarae]MBO9638318.1 AI-2E family transporter [Siphonobacter aquaeclarae]SDL49737.1 Predicted PurR-regulated permease PerM [Siphonobacter aquaeclarae]
MASIYTEKQQRYLLIMSLVAIAGFILAGLRQYTTAFLGAGILFVIFRPWFKHLVHEKKYNRTWVSSGLLLFAILVIIIPFLVLSLLLIDRVRYYSNNYDEILRLVKRMEDWSGFSLTQEDNVRSLIQQGASWASQQFPSLISGAVDIFIILGLLFFTLYYMFAEEERFLAGVKRYIPFDPKTTTELGESLKNMVNANILGQGLISLVQGVLTGLTLWIFGVPDSAFWGTVAFFMGFIPVLGTPLVWGPAGLIVISQGDTGRGVGILLVGVIVIMNIDNVLRIVLAKRMGDVHPLITLAGVVLGVPLFGILGLVIGPLLIAYFIVLFKVFERQNKALLKNE